MRSGIFLMMTSTAVLLFTPLVAQAQLGSSLPAFRSLEVQTPDVPVLQVRHKVRHGARYQYRRKPAHERLQERPRQPGGAPANAPPQGKQEG